MRRILLSHKVTALLLLVALFLGTGTVFYSNVEHLRALDALYFSVITLTTVGYGDFSPHTDAGKIFTIFYLLLGIGVFLALIAIIADNVINNYRRITESYLAKAERHVDDLISDALRKR